MFLQLMWLQILLRRSFKPFAISLAIQMFMLLKKFLWLQHFQVSSPLLNFLVFLLNKILCFQLINHSLNFSLSHLKWKNPEKDRKITKNKLKVLRKIVNPISLTIFSLISTVAKNPKRLLKLVLLPWIRKMLKSRNYYIYFLIQFKL